MTQKHLSKYYQLSGELQKLSTSIFIGYQTKFFQIKQNGTKIAYKNLNEDNFQQKNTFLIKDVVVCEAEQNFTFSLQTPRRTFLLKAANQQTKTIWMKAITKLRKQIIRKKFKLKHCKKSPTKTNFILSSTDHTAPHSTSLILNLLNQTQTSIQSPSPINHTHRTIRTTSLLPNPQKQKLSFIQSNQKLSNLLSCIPQQYIKYNTYIINLKTKIQNLFTASYVENIYVLFSSKSLYPLEEETILDENLTNLMLPQWAEVNKIYKVMNNNNGNKMDSVNSNYPKLFIQISKIIDIQQPNHNSQQKQKQSSMIQQKQKTSIKIRTSDTVHTLYCHTIQQKHRLLQIFQTSLTNLKQSTINSKLTKKNYDKLIWSYYNNKQQFQSKTKSIINKFIPQSHQYQPEIVIKFIDLLIPFIQQFGLILKNKKQQCNEILLHVLKQLHQQTKIHIKLTWDTSYTMMKNQNILKFLNALAAYHSVIKIYISDFQFLTGMKQLSKIYVRQSWKHFQDIILGIVQQQKKPNIYQDEDNQYIQTNSVIDLFKFIYQVFQLAAPCWQHKLHLHNVQKLMYRAIEVYINQLKASVDQTVIANRQLIAIANNYFRFSITVDQFYNEKFKELQEKTKENYDQLKSNYKQLSMIILDKLAFDVRIAIKKYFEKTTFFKIDIEKIYQIIKQSSESLQIHCLHNLFIKRFYQKLFQTIRESILHLLQLQISKSSKKKPSISISKIIPQIDKISFDLIDISNLLYKGKPKIDKDLNEINILLQCQKHSEIIQIIKGAGEDVKTAYMNIVQLRDDYYVGGPLYYALHQDEKYQKSSVAAKNSEGKSTLQPIKLSYSLQKSMRASFSSYYMNNDFDLRSIASKDDQQSVYQPLKLISEGYLLKCKTNNKKIWQKQYFRLKNGTLYLYHSQKSQKCQNSILISQILQISPSSLSQQPLTFSISYLSLNRQKHLQLKSQTIQLRDRWIDSINLQIKRVKNDQKVNKNKLKLQQKKKNYLIIDYEELMNGKGYFSYTQSSIPV